MIRALAIVALLSRMQASAAPPAIVGAIDHQPARAEAVFFVRTGESLLLTAREGDTGKPVRWYQVEPKLHAYDNHPGRSSKLDAIIYHRRPLDENVGSQLVLRFSQPGTRYFADGAVVPERFSESEPLQRKYVGRIVQVVVRGGDEYCDFLGELFGTPFIMGPTASAGGWHQTDQRIGSDCAAFATYGQRRMGKRVPYAGPTGIVEFLRPLTPAPFAVPSADGCYHDSRKRMIPVGGHGIRRGDLVHFGDQVSVFYADRGKRGWLDADDLVLQSWRTQPHRTTIRVCGFFSRPVRVYRWR